MLYIHMYPLVTHLLNAMFMNISAISWRSVVLVEEAGGNHRPWASSAEKIRKHNVEKLTHNNATQESSRITVLPIQGPP
jgi:hypothetical protein